MLFRMSRGKRICPLNIDMVGSATSVCWWLRVGLSPLFSSGSCHLGPPVDLEHVASAPNIDAQIASNKLARLVSFVPRLLEQNASQLHSSQVSGWTWNVNFISYFNGYRYDTVGSDCFHVVRALDNPFFTYQNAAPSTKGLF